MAVAFNSCSFSGANINWLSDMPTSIYDFKKSYKEN